jgi:hypothetical protein
MRLIAMVILTGLAGCVPATVVILKDPASGQVVRCDRTSSVTLFPIAQTLSDNAGAESCARGYEAAGWKRMN